MNNKKSIWLFCHYAATPNYSSFGFRQFFFAKQWIKKGYDVNIVSSAYDHYMFKYPKGKSLFIREKIEGVNFIWIKNIKYKNSYGLLRIINWIIFSFLIFFIKKPTNTPSIIICSSPTLISFISVYLFKIRYKHSKLILEIRDIWPLTLTELGKKSKLNPFIILFRILEKFAYKKADHIVGTMPKLDLHIKNSIKSDFNFTCIPQGIDLDFQTKSENFNIDDKLSFPTNPQFVVGYAGSMALSNALDTIIEAAIQIEKIYPEIIFCFIGSGNNKKHLQSKALNSNNIKFYDKVPKEYILSFLRKCDVLYDSVLKSNLYKYGISRNKWADYMYSSKPIIISYSGYEDIISEIGNGFIVDPQNKQMLINKILELYKFNKKELKIIGKKGYDFIIKNRNYSVISQEYIEKVF